MHQKRNLVLRILVASCALALACGDAVAAQYVFRKIVDNSSVFADFQTQPVINNAGQVAFGAILSNNTNGVFVGTVGSLTTLAVDDQPGIVAGSLFGVIPSINSQGDVAFFVNLDGLGPGIALSSGGTLQPIYNTSNTSFNDFGYPWLNDAGQVAFLAAEGPTYGIYRGDGGPMTTIVESATNGFSYNPTMNNSGTVAYYVNNTESLTSDGVSTTTIATLADGFVYIDQGQNNDLGTVAFRALTATGEGIYVGDGGAVSTFVDSSGPLDVFFFPAINNFGQIAFLGEFDTIGEGIFTGPDVDSDRVIQTGDLLFGSLVVELFMLDGGLNDFGTIAFQYQLANGEMGIAIAMVPEPGSLALAGLIATMTICLRQRAQRRSTRT